MTPAARPPRPEQIDELTRGLDLPLPALDEAHLTLIAEVLALAWTDLAHSQGRTLLQGSEAEINALLATRLGRLLDEHPLWEQLVRCVTRGTETISFDGTRLESRPDLSIHLSTRTPSFPLLVECKLMDAPAGKSIALYCDKGLTRFVDGRYGWAVREAFMLAYVRDRSTTASCMLPFLESVRGKFNVDGVISGAAHPSLDIARTAHARSFRYGNRALPGGDPGAIAIWHLWLQLEKPQGLGPDDEPRAPTRDSGRSIC